VTHALHVTKAGRGTGTVTSSPAGINCGSTCVATFTGGTTVTLAATPGTRSRFAGWSGDCSGTGACVLSMTVDHSVTATFARRAPHCVVPNVVGLSLAKATLRIVRAHCTTGNVKRVTSSARKKGKVLSQRPGPGTKLRNGAKVGITVGKGPKKR
jgi:endoglucanase